MTDSKKALNAKVLVVEDDPISANLVNFLLKREGFEVVLAKDGREACQLIEQLPPPDVILLDMMLPYMDGMQVINRIRHTAGWQQVPTLILTSDATERTTVLALDAGADDYVVKPFRAQELMARLRRSLRSTQDSHVLAPS